MVIISGNDHILLEFENIYAVKPNINAASADLPWELHAQTWCKITFGSEMKMISLLLDVCWPGGLRGSRSLKNKEDFSSPALGKKISREKVRFYIRNARVILILRSCYEKPSQNPPHPDPAQTPPLPIPIANTMAIVVKETESGLD